MKLLSLGAGGSEGRWESDLCINGGDPPTPNWEWGGSSIQKHTPRAAILSLSLVIVFSIIKCVLVYLKHVFFKLSCVKIVHVLSDIFK